MGFQILTKDNKAISLNDLDKEACEFWHQEFDPKHYAQPGQDDPTKDELTNLMNRGGNWFDVIGYCIHRQQDAESGWTNVVKEMLVENIGEKFIDLSAGNQDRPVQVAKFEPREGYPNQVFLPESVEIAIYGILAYYRPYIDLINHWHSKGYKPKKVE